MQSKPSSRLLNPGGGLRYHARALLRRRSRWRGFREGLHQWLEEWLPESERTGIDLLLVAPSAGHCLPGSWLSSFKSLTAIDWDPVAEPLFRRTHQGQLRPNTLSWIRADVFQHWNSLLEQNPKHAILFCNFLGQADSCGEPSVVAPWFESLRRTLPARRWASFHDRYSGGLPIRENVPPLKCGVRAEAGTLLSTFYDSKTRGELTEHELPPIFPAEGAYSYLAWPLARGQNHLIEAYFPASVAPPATS